jgi:hypothetical protein
VSDRLILEIEVPDFNVDGAQDAADEFCDGDLHFIVTEEWMREDVIVVANDIPGEKNLNSDFEIHALTGRIVGARIVRDDSNPAKRPPVLDITESS